MTDDRKTQGWSPADQQQADLEDKIERAGRPSQPERRRPTRARLPWVPPRVEPVDPDAPVAP